MDFENRKLNKTKREKNTNTILQYNTVVKTT